MLALLAVLALTTTAGEDGGTRSTVDYGPDLAVSAGDMTISKPVLLSGVFFNVSIKVYNLGDEDANGVTVDLLVNAQQTHRKQVADIPVDGWELVSFELSLPKGDHTVGVLVDAEDVIDERREDNNDASVDLHVRGLPDAMVNNGAIQVSNEHPMEGEVLTIGVTVTNNGESAATLVVVQFWDGPVDDGFLIANRTTSVPATGQRLVTTEWDTSDKGGTHEINVVLALVLPGEEELSNNAASVTVLVFTQWDLVIDSGTGDVTIDQEWTQDGFVTVRDGATLAIEEVTFEVLQDYANQFALFVEGGGRLVLSGAVVESELSLLVILEDGTRLSLLEGSTLVANVVMEGGVTTVLEDSILIGGLAGNATSVEIVRSEVTGPVALGSCNLAVEGSLLSSGTPCKLAGSKATMLDSSVSGSATQSLDLSCGATVELRNVTCGGIGTDDPSKAMVFRRVEVLVVDESNLVIPGATVDITHYINGSVIASGVGGGDGKVLLEVLSDVLEGGESHFIGNYLIHSTFSLEEGSEPLLLEPFPAMDQDANLPTATVVLPPIEPRDLISSSTGDWVVEEGQDQTLVADFVQDGSILVEGTLAVSSATLSILQDRDHQFFVVVEGDGLLLLEGGTLTSEHPLNVYLYDNATLRLGDGAALRVNALVAKDGAKLEVRGSVVEARLLLRGGPVSLEDGCQVVSDLMVVETSTLVVKGGTYTVDELRLDSPALAIEGISLTGRTVEMSTDFANITDCSWSLEAVRVEATILTVKGSAIHAEEPLKLSVATFYMDTSSTNVLLSSNRSDSNYYLTDADVPRPFSVGNATVLVYWYLTTRVMDVLGNPVASINVAAAYTNNGTEVATGVTNDDGEVRFPLLGSIVEPDGEYFVGNYRVTVHNPIDEEETLVRYINLDRAKTLMTSFGIPMVPPTMVGVEISVENTTVEAGQVFDLVGYATAIFPTVRSALSQGVVEVRLWNNDTSWDNDTVLDEEGGFSVPVPAPEGVGVYYLKVVVTPTGPYGGVSPGVSNVLTIEVAPPGPEWLFVVLDATLLDPFPAGTTLTIRGTVRYDRASGNPTPNAQVFVNDPITRQTRQVKADGVGVFEIDLDGPTFYGQYDYLVTAKDPRTGLTTKQAAKLVVIAAEQREEEEGRSYQWIWWVLLVVVLVVVVIAATLSYWTFSTKGRMVECGECGTLVPETALQCPKCGIEFEVEVAKCSVCGSWIRSDAESCSYCGTPFKDIDEVDGEEMEEEVPEAPTTVSVDEAEVSEEMDITADEDEVEAGVPVEAVRTVPEGIRRDGRPKPVVRKRQVGELEGEDPDRPANDNGVKPRPVVKKVVSHQPAAEEPPRERDASEEAEEEVD